MRINKITRMLGIAALGATLFCLTSAQGSLQLISGTPQSGNSWFIGFTVIDTGTPPFSTPFDNVVLNILPPAVPDTTDPIGQETFEDPGMLVFGAVPDPTPWTATLISPTSLVASAPGSQTTYLNFLLLFLGDGSGSSAIAPYDFILDAKVYNGTDLKATFQVPWVNGEQGAIVVPEPSTVIAGGLLLLPFGLATLRRLRK